MTLPRQIDRYQVQAVLGEGGSGTVVRAFDPRVGCTVAIKILRNPGGRDSRVRTRLQREIQALCKLQHPNIVKARDVGELEGSPFVVLDFVQGLSLTDRVNKGGPLGEDEAAELVRALCRAISHAHGNGVLHRDLNPNNVLLARDGTPVLIDFGLTLQTDSQVDARLSSPGAFLGTPGYWAPEQARGQLNQMSNRTDVFGLGGILLFALTGEPPYRGESMADLLSAAMNETPVDLARVPSRFRAACARALAKDPEARYPSAADLGAALSESSGKAAAGGRGVLVAATLVLVGLVVAGLVAMNLHSSAKVAQASPSPSAPATMAPPPTPSAAPSATTPTPAATPPESSELSKRVARANTLIKEKRFKQAHAILKEAVAEAPDDPEATLAMGIASLALNDAPNARLYLDRALALRPTHPLALEYRAHVEAREAKFGLAATAYALAAKHHPDLGRIRLEWARNVFLAGKNKDALAVLDAAPPKLQERGRWQGLSRILRSSILRDLGRVDDAVAELTHVIQGGNAGPYVFFMRAILHLAAGLQGACYKDLDAACRGGIPLPFVWRHILRGTPLPTLNRGAEPKEGGLWIETIYGAVGKKTTLKNLLDQAKRRMPAKLRLRRLTEAYCYLGLCHERAKRMDRATRAYELAVQTGYRDETEHFWAKTRLARFRAARPR